MRDTPKQVEQRYREMLLYRSPSERLRMVSRMFDSGRRLLIAGLRERQEEIVASRLRELLFLRLYGDDFVDADRKRIINHLSSKR